MRWAALPVLTAITAATVPTRISVVAAGPVKGSRPVSDTQRKATPTSSRAITKWTTCGCQDAQVIAKAMDCMLQLTVQRRESLLFRSHRLAQNLVHFPPDQLGPLPPAPLGLGADLLKTVLDIGDLEGAQGILGSEVTREELLESLADHPGLLRGDGIPLHRDAVDHATHRDPVDHDNRARRGCR